MEGSRDPIGARTALLNSSILGKVAPEKRQGLPGRETLLDAFQALFDECGIEILQKTDRQIASFYEKYKNTILELKKTRVNVTDFEIGSVIGRGHFGEVHVVKEKQTGDIYAMKTVRKSDSLEKTCFEIEREILANNHSPWLTSLQYAFQDTTRLYYVMEYHPGGDLLGLLYRQGGTLPETAATFYVAELVLALEDMHNMGYVHRDIKPDNMLLDRCGHLKLVDFGSAARIGKDGLVEKGAPVGTPDYVAPEVLRSMEGRPGKVCSYGVSCDYWSLGILAFELTTGKPPFTGPDTTTTYSRIMNHTNNFKFPPDISLTQAYTSFVKGLVCDINSRLNAEQVKTHALFKNCVWDSLRDQVPPHVPKVTSLDDTSNFNDMSAPKKGVPSMENYKRKTQFTGRNLPFVGFTYTGGAGAYNERSVLAPLNAKNDAINALNKELEKLRREAKLLVDREESMIILENKLREKAQKLEAVEDVRGKLERELASNISECTAIKRTLEIERKDRSELERKALDLIKSAKLKWEVAEKTRIETMRLEIDQQRNQIDQLVATNAMLNQQIQQALKTEERKQRDQRESLGMVERLSRRSVAGLETRIERLTLETKSTIGALQGKNQQMEFELRELKRERDLATSRQDEAVKKAMTWAEDRLEKLERENMVLSKSLEEFEVERQQGIESRRTESEALKKKILESEKALEESNSMREALKLELEKQSALLRIEVKGRSDLKAEVEQLNSQLAEQTQKAKQIYTELSKSREDNCNLMKQLDELSSSQSSAASSMVSSASVAAASEMRELRSKMYRTEKDLKNCEIDKRILQRELKESAEEIKCLNAKIAELNESLASAKKVHASALLELNAMNESNAIELVRTKEAFAGVQSNLDAEKKIRAQDKAAIEELRKRLNEKERKIDEIRREVSDCNKKMQALENKLSAAESGRQVLHLEIDGLKERNGALENELDAAKKQAERTELNYQALKEACTLLESQLIELEKMNALLSEQRINDQANTQRLIADLCQAKQQIQEARREANEEKSLKLRAEVQIKRLGEEKESLENECSSNKNQSLQFKEYSAKLAEELNIAEQKIAGQEININILERQLDGLEDEGKSLKEDISKYLTQISALKETNSRLKREVGNLKLDLECSKDKSESLERLLEEKINYFTEREMKDESTIKQQTKLIDFLQMKIDEEKKKKMTFAHKIFGHSKKENQPPVTLVYDYKELEKQLQQEKENNKSLRQELSTLKKVCAVPTGVKRHKSEITGTSPKSLQQQQHLHKGFPSSWKSASMRSPNVKQEKKCPGTLLEQSPTGPPKFEAWVKVLSRQNRVWEKRYARLWLDQFIIYTSKDDGRPVESFKFVTSPGQSLYPNLTNTDAKEAAPQGKVVLEPLESEIGVPVADSDLPFVVKVQIGDQDGGLNVIFMALSIEERQQWYAGFQQIFGFSNSTHPDLEHVISLSVDVMVFCAAYLTPTIAVFGTNRGLYASQNGATPIRIEGPSSVRAIALFPSVHALAMVAEVDGNRDTLIGCDITHVINVSQCATECAKPLLLYTHICPEGDLRHSFRFLAGCEPTAKRQLLLAASEQHLIIAEYDLSRNRFVPVRLRNGMITMDTAVPVTCAIFAEHSIVVGADKFFEIDSGNFGAEEFVDPSDARLSHIFTLASLGSYPISIFRISTNPIEFLLCFAELCVFVDEFGRMARHHEVKTCTEHVSTPVAFEYVPPYLYVIGQKGVKVVHIGENGIRDVTVVATTQPLKLLGQDYRGKKAILLSLSGHEVKRLKGSAVDAESALETSDDSDVSISNASSNSNRFSFTSSVVHSLDGNLSDDESENDCRRVKFSKNL